MEFNVERIENPNIKKYSDDELSLAYEFTKRMYEEFGTFLKAVVLFGSAARREKREKGDVDILVIVDDTLVNMIYEVVETYRIILEKIITDVSPKLHVTSLKLTTFWEYIRAGDPVGINILRDGVAMIDSGFFDPLRVLLSRGKIRPSPESISIYLDRAPKTLHNSKWHILQATLDLYWAVIDSAHAALMKLGEMPASPAQVADLMDRRMVQAGIVGKKFPKVMRELYELQKKIMHREVKEISAKEYERLLKDATEFVNAMQDMIKKG